MIAHAVAVRIRGDTVLTRISDAVVIGILLIGIKGSRAIVANIEDPVAVGV
jgi:hypothetical protein